jgi:hypothetical protein
MQLSVALICIYSLAAFGQQIRTPRPSPDATVTQIVGVTEVSIDYSSPGVKGREIWGGLVPFGEVWRTGANEVTSITFSDPVKVNGNDLPAGTYGIHTIPGESEWEFIFSKDTKVDDGSNYDPSKDALRIKVKPAEHHFMERMTFLFTDVTDKSVNVNLVWDKLLVSFKIETNTNENFLSEVYWNTRVKAQLQYKLGMKDDAISTMEKAVDLGSKMDSVPFDYDNMKKLLADWK